MVFEKVREIICDPLDVAEDDVTMESNIADDLGADSLDVVDLVMSLEEEFDAEFPDEDIESIKTVGDVVKFIEEHVYFRLFPAACYSQAAFFLSFVEIGETISPISS